MFETKILISFGEEREECLGGHGNVWEDVPSSLG